MILQTTIDKVFEVPIVEVIQGFVDLKRSGANYKGLSPFSSERSPSFMVSPSKNIFKDFSSGKGGTAVNFLMESQHMNFPEAIRHICAKFNIEVEETIDPVEQADKVAKESLYIINDAAIYFFQHNSFSQKEIMNFSKDRNLNFDLIADTFKIGFAPNDFSMLTNYLVKQKSFQWDLCVQTSLIGYKNDKIYDRFRNRIIFPIRNITGKVVGFGGRDIAWVKGSKSPKYLNSSDSLIYSKGEVLYGIFENKKNIIEANHCLISEGYTDVIGFTEAGVNNIVSASGTAFTIEQARLIKRLTSSVTVLFDSDESGIKAASRGIDVLLSQGIAVKVCVLPDGQDPDTYRIGKTKEQILEYINKNSKDFIVFKLEILLKDKDDFIGKGNAITEIISSIAKITNPIQREVYIKECSRITDVDISALRMMLTQITADDFIFEDVSDDFKNEAVQNNRTFLLEQCERNIIQHLLVHGDLELDFKDVILEDDGLYGLEEVAVTQRMTVKQKIIKEISQDDFHFTNVNYSMIYETAQLNDLSDFNSWQALFGNELYLICSQLKETSEAENLSSFEQDGVKTYEYIMRGKSTNLQNSIAESLLFFKYLSIENMVEKEMKENEPDVDYIFSLIDLNLLIKTKLNVI